MLLRGGRIKSYICRTMNQLKKRKRLDKQEALSTMQRYCAYQDRCHKEVRTRLLEHQVYGDELEEVIVELISEDFLNEERYARSYARGKFRMKKWGRLKIMRELKFNLISDYCIRKGMSEIDDEDYRNTLEELLTKKQDSYKSNNPYEMRKKLFTFAVNKGYETEVINEVLNRILKPEQL